MPPKRLLFIFTAIGAAPFVLWSLVSLVASACLSRHFSMSLRFYFPGGTDLGGLSIDGLPVFTSVCILAGAALLLWGVASLPSRD